MDGPRLRRSTVAAAVSDAKVAVLEYDNARAWLAEHGAALDAAPLAVEVWLFDPDLTMVLLVKHRWRQWVPPGGKVENGETPREAAERELFEETGLRAELRREPAAVAVRSYHPDWSATLGLSYVAIGEPAAPVQPEDGQAVEWMSLSTPWTSYFPDDLERMRRYVDWTRSLGAKDR